MIIQKQSQNNLNSKNDIYDKLTNIVKTNILLRREEMVKQGVSISKIYESGDLESLHQCWARRRRRKEPSSMTERAIVLVVGFIFTVST